MALKRRIIYALGALSLFASCSSPVSSVTVKAKPTLYASLGQYSYQVSSYITPSKIESLLNSNSGFFVYNYQPSSTTSASSTSIVPQEYLLRFPLLSVPLNVGASLANLNLSNSVNATLPAQSFSIPSISQSVSVTNSFDVSAVLRNSVNNGLSPQSAQTVETGLASPPPATISLPLTLSTFSTATVATGSLNLTFGPLSGTTASYTFTLTRISLISNGQTLSTTASNVNLLVGGTANLPFAASTTLPNSFQVVLTASTSGGTAGHVDTFTMQAALSNDFSISSASGVNFSTVLPLPATTLPFNATSNFVSATVASGNGQMVFSPGNLPTAWSGFTQNTSIGVSQTGGLNLNQSGSGPLTLDLSNQTVSGSTISLTGNTTINAINATLSGLSGPVPIANSAAISITEFSSVVVKVSSSFTPSVVIDDNLQSTLSPQDFQKWQWLNWVDFTSLGYSVSFTSNLPAGNDMSMTVNSQAFGVSQTQTIPSGSPTNPVTLNFLSGSTTTPYRYIPSHNYGPGAWVIDMGMSLQPKSWNPNTGELTLFNIIPGTTLGFSATITPVITWSQANLSPPAGGYSGNFPASGGYNLSVLSKYLGTNFLFPPIPAYLYFSGLPTSSINGMSSHIQAQYTANGILTTTDLLGTSTTPANVVMLASSPTFPPDGGTVTSIPTPSSATITDLSPPFNAKPADLTFGYSMNMSSVTITYAEATAPGAQNLEADLVVPLPMQFIIPASGASLNFNSGTSDFFGRTGPTSNTVNNLLGQLTSVTVSLNLDNTTGLTGSAVFSDSSGFSKTLTLATGPTSIQFQLTAADISHIINTIPFAPSLQVTLNPSGAAETVTLPANGISGTASVTAVADINQTYNF